MKLLLLSALCMVAVCSFAQLPQNIIPGNRNGLLHQFKGAKGDTLNKQFQEYLRRNQLQNNPISDKNGRVITLPQDNMPCIVPDPNAAVVMPNAWSEKITVPYRPQYHPIPNPSLPPISLNYRLSRQLSVC